MWNIPNGYTWIPTTVYAGLPPSAVYAGNDSDGSPIYVGRAYFEGQQLPCKVMPSKNAAYVSYAGKEHFVSNYEGLSGHGFTWIQSGHGHVPAGAVVAGNNSGEPLYIGRAHFQGSLTPGKVHRSHACLYIPYGGDEHAIRSYEVLVGSQRSNWVSASSYGPVPDGAILAGNDVDGSPIYVGKAFHDGDLIPAKVIPSKNVAYVSYNGVEVQKHQFEVLCNGNVSWVPSGHGQIPHNAVVGGHTSSGETLYIGRTHYMGSLTPGKVHPSHGSLYIPFGGAEIPHKSKLNNVPFD
ncbi:hypothetical protein Bhyg_08735 [Pseudolycoriella hygida]|uniref:Uncharacterized protein n=1 Tax=Pseudolycoriella hygida TaxID=35572 RepID=A0A9Q0S586_9DIPT|nr:hypothetical protein Bhyg_08735 [Pseudolycoriella hygida]